MEFFSERCPWYVAGPFLGLIVFALQWASNLPLGVTASLADLKDWLARPVSSRPSWRVYFIIGIALGAAAHALAVGQLAPTFGYGSFDRIVSGALGGKGLVLAAAGLCIGFGARVAGGCTSGHGICGMSRGSLASLVSTGIFVTVAILVARAVELVFGGTP